MYLITQLCHTLLGKYMGYKGKRSIEKNLLTMVATKIDREEQNKKIHIRKVYRVLNSSLRSSHFIICSISLQKSTTCFKITWGAQQNTETWGLSYTYIPVRGQCYSAEKGRAQFTSIKWGRERWSLNSGEL